MSPLSGSYTDGPKECVSPLANSAAPPPLIQIWTGAVLETITFTLWDVTVAVRRFRQSYSPGPDGVAISIIKADAYDIFPSLLSYPNEPFTELKARILENFVDEISLPESRCQFFHDPPGRIKVAIDIARHEEALHTACPLVQEYSSSGFGCHKAPAAIQGTSVNVFAMGQQHRYSDGSRAVRPYTAHLSLARLSAVSLTRELSATTWLSYSPREGASGSQTVDFAPPDPWARGGQAGLVLVGELQSTKQEIVRLAFRVGDIGNEKESEEEKKILDNIH
ncbi:unnamed protein product [Schistocephalus solidus]|uniref:Similar to n=1 Tax=Schistocephalus solidus TaxID=70667 RepID=A0A183TAV3_SCHSO|nr:unnamed protein product [Schistocephalus solidus]